RLPVSSRLPGLPRSRMGRPVQEPPLRRAHRPFLGLPRTHLRLLPHRPLLHLHHQLLLRRRVRAVPLPQPPAPPALPARRRRAGPSAGQSPPAGPSTRPRFSAHTARPSSSSRRSSRPAIAGAFLSPLREPSACTSRGATKA